MKALSLARTTAEEALAAGHVNQTSGPVFMFSPLRKNKLYPMKIKLCDKMLLSLYGPKTVRYYKGLSAF